MREHHISPAGGEVLEPEGVFGLEPLQKPEAVLAHTVHDIEHAALSRFIARLQKTENGTASGQSRATPAILPTGVLTN